MTRAANTLSFKSDVIVSLSVSPDMSCIASASNVGGYANVWQLETTQKDSASSKGYGSHSVITQDVSFAPNGKLFAAASVEKSVEIDSLGCSLWSIPSRWWI